MLDTPLSTKRIILLAQIGKEGWDCRSLAGVVLSQEGDCRRNMVLQTSCRCLREVVHGDSETAIIVLNDKNATHLEKQLQQTQRIDLKTFQTGRRDDGVVRHSRVRKLDLPQIDHVRFELSRELRVSRLENADIDRGLCEVAAACRVTVGVESVENLDFSGNASSYECVSLHHGVKPISYRKWKHGLFNEVGPAPAGLIDFEAGRDGPHNRRDRPTKPKAFVTAPGYCEKHASGPERRATLPNA